MWTVSQQTLANHVLTLSSVLGGEPPAADEAEGPTSQGANIFLGDSDKRGGEEEKENKFFFCSFIFGCAGSAAARSFPLAVASGGCVLVAALWFLSAAASLAAEHRL